VWRRCRPPRLLPLDADVRPVSRRFWSSLAGAVLVPVVALGAAACGSSEKTLTLPTVPATTSTTSEATTVAPTTVAPRAGTPTPTTVRSAAKPAGGGSAGGGSSSPAGSAALSPPAAGTYRYTTSGASTFGLTTVPYPAVSTLTVDPPTGTRQHSTRNLRDAAGNGPVLELVLDYRPEGILAEDLKLTVGAQGMTNVQDLRPSSPMLFLAAGAGPGAHQEFDVSGGGSTAHLTVDVERQERVTIGGQGVDTLVVHLAAALPPGEVSGRLDMTASFAPSVRLWVKEHFVTDAVGGGGLFRFHSQYDATLQRLP
jgi:hypothetical protein